MIYVVHERKHFVNEDVAFAEAEVAPGLCRAVCRCSWNAKTTTSGNKTKRWRRVESYTATGIFAVERFSYDWCTAAVVPPWRQVRGLVWRRASTGGSGTMPRLPRRPFYPCRVFWHERRPPLPTLQT